MDHSPSLPDPMSSGSNTTPCTPQAGAWWHPLVPALLALPGLVAAGEPSGTRSDRVVVALLGLLVCLAVGLAVAWHHLCRLSAGHYHPRPLGRRAVAVMRGRWHQLCGQGDPVVQPGRGDGEVAAVAPQEEELMPWSQEQRPEEEEEEEEEAEVAPHAGESPPSVGQAAGGSAEALLGDLHAFSGTAAWGDTRPHVTAL
ncbi:protein tyrosine phosphatase receptor type C-associated protein [Podargus strigoides]